MTEDLSQLAILKLKPEGYVTYGDKNRGRILGKGNIETEETTIINDVLYVEGLKHNLLNISQLFDKRYKVKFEYENCLICNEDTSKLVFTGKRFNNIYLLDIHHNASINECLISKE